MCFFSNQKTAYEMRSRDWSSDVCSSDLDVRDLAADDGTQAEVAQRPGRVLARRAATEVVAGDQDRGAGVLGPVERKIRVRPAVGEIAPVVERNTATAFALRGREKAARVGLVGVGVAFAQHTGS